MSESPTHYPNPPIVEGILDIECDLPAGFELETIEEAARDAFRDSYSKFQMLFLQKHRLESAPGEDPKLSTDQGLNALQFLNEDENQLVQLRPAGFAFNRLKPYSSLDDYLDEIERCWGIFCELVEPIQIRLIRLRYINRILLPLNEDGNLELDDYLASGLKPPCEERLALTGFLNQFSAIDKESGHVVNLVLTAEEPEDGMLPVIFDNGVSSASVREADDWSQILNEIKSLRILKNLIFESTLTDECRELFQE